MARQRDTRRAATTWARVLVGRVSLPAFVVMALAATGWPVGCGSSNTPAGPSAGQHCQSCKPLQMVGISGPGCDDGNGACRSFTAPTSHELCCANADCSDCADAGTPTCTRCTGTVFDCSSMPDCCECASRMPDGSLEATADSRSTDVGADSPEELAESTAPADAGMRCPTAQDCMGLAQNECARISACEPWVFSREYTDPSDCTKQIAADCAVLECDPSTDPTKIAFGNASAFAACVNALQTASCFDFLNNYVSACDLRGNKPNGSPCSLNAQCASGDCVVGSPCGVCTQKADVGGACTTNADCNLKQICYPPGAGTCQPASDLGAACSATIQCGLPNSCINLSCAAPAKLGAPCGANNPSCDVFDDGTLCTTNDAGAATCVATPTSAAGGSCANGEVCTGGSVCNGTTCIRLGVGDSCGASNPCPLTLVCSSARDAGAAVDSGSGSDAAATTCQPIALCP